jgi:hypothetical protein
MASLGPIGSTVSYDLKLPLAQANRFWFGASQLYISIPSRGVYNHFAGTGGQGTGGQGTGGQGTGGQGGACASTHCDGPACEQCTTDNCFPPTDGCDLITDPADKQLCETLYGCFVAPTHPGTSIPGPCTNQGDPTRCWCGTNPTTCLTDPAAANGPCRDAVVAAAKTADPGTIKLRFVDPAFPLGRAVNLSSCRGSFCGPPPNGSGECRVP